ncbi:type II toxin-antitoxin system VapC family toxin [Sphaerospermopsis torques-reginae]|jgi:ribonuclease VapC|uniref:Type II toxin-antitoxin system VapC family toxin n=1 Tax=Sphaerospermopsis torques-reginae ITEP-024 TaxID=984208 RepID=A0ABX8WYS0_9CYAN|nr:type II toxin-antitoxin system VapC family toxin [Sphaerospermopsis torques-reginae]QYX31598.1 type II toxin-antitoxin system VapC family toxin [Sphaerospermopsis torques-reginae ITEP-024]
MVIDTSAILAIIYGEPEELIFIELINESEECLLSSPSSVEASIVLGTKHGEKGVENLKLLIETLSITIVPFTIEQAQLASEGFLKFGKGRHPAKLNMGDCFSYALAKFTNQPLLFKGNDFIHTDVEQVKY